MKKKIVAWMLTIMTVVIFVPMISFGAETDGTTNNEEEQITNAPELRAAGDEGGENLSGSCGEYLTWVLEDGVLTISGTGEMYDYRPAVPYNEKAPWYEDKNSITQVNVESGVTSIGNYAFVGLTNMTNITLPDGVTRLGDNAFEGCIGLTSITVPKNVSSIGEYAFNNCTGLTSVILPNGLESIGGYAFGNSPYLTDMTIPRSVTNIGANALSGSLHCTFTVYTDYAEQYMIDNNLQYVRESESHTHDMISHTAAAATCTDAGNSAYWECRECGKFFLDQEGTEEIEKDSWIIGATGHDWGEWEVTKEATTEETGLKVRTCNYNSAHIEEEVIPKIENENPSGTDNGINWSINSNGVLSIEGSGEMNNYSVYDDGTTAPWGDYADQIKAVVISEGITSIGEYSFIACTNIESISLPSGISEIGSFAFYNNKVTEVQLPDTVISIGDYAFAYCRNLDNLIIPQGITTIGAGAFTYCTSLSSIDIPTGVTRIGFDTFSGCNSLESVIIPEGLSSIGGGAFRDCTSLKTVSIPEGVTIIESSTFYGCENITSITLPEGITAIGPSAFSHCKKLETITLPETIASIGAYAFQECNSLTGISLPKGVTYIGAYAFQNNFLMQDIILPEGITEIPAWTFAGCYDLSNISLPESITSIGDDAFLACSSLTDFIIPSNVTSIGAYTFQGCYLTSITLPDSITQIGERGLYCNNGNCKYYLFKNSYADLHIDSENKVYLSDKGYTQDPIFVFKNKTINIIEGELLTLSDSIISTEEIDWNNVSVTVSDDDIVFYDNDEIAGLSSGSTEIEVTNGTASCVATINVIDSSTVIPLEGVSLGDDVTLNKGTKQYIQPQFSPTNTTQQHLTWKSSNEKAVSVKDGTITAIAPGKATVTAAYSEEISASLEVTVVAPLLDICIMEPEESSQLSKGSTTKVKYYLYPYDTTDTNPMEFSSSDDEIISADDNGSLTALKPGKATIAVTKGEISKDIEIEVVSNLTGVSLSKGSVITDSVEDIQLEVIYTPEDATNITKVEWSSNKESVATVNDDGLVSIKGKGIATITVTVNDEFTATCRIVVNKITMTGISISDLSLRYGETGTVDVKYYPEITTDDKTTQLSSSDEAVVKVTDDGTLETTGVGSATITAACGDFTDTCTVIVNKAIPEYAEPEALNTTCNTLLKDISLPTGFEWMDGTESVGKAGEKTFKAKYVPDNTELYEIIEDIDIGLVVEHSFKDSFLHDEDGHWQECVCGEKTPTEEHTYGEWTTTKEPTCTEEGVKERVCDICGEKKTGVVEALGHDYEEVEGSAVAASCTEPGKEADEKCSRCDDVKTGKAIQALGHNMEGHAAGEATCTKDGNSAYWNCDRCNKYFSDEAGETEIGENSWVIEALGHDYEAIEGSAVAASCTEPGKEADEKCSRCDDVKTGKAIQALGHNMEGHAAGEATCTKDGNSAYWNCDRCNKYFSDEAGETEIGENSWVIEALGHDYEAIEGSAVAASCTKPGKEADEKCSRCDDVKTGKAIQALGHNMEGHAAGEATCTKDGNSAYWNCDRCNKYFSDEAGETEIGENSWVIEALGHDYEAIEGSAVAASCTKPGKEADEKCSRCDDVKTGKAIQALGHNMEGHAAGEATCTKDGNSAYWNCDRCNKYFSDEAGETEIGENSWVIEALGHDYEAIEGSAVAASCTEPGKEADEKCSRCDDVKTGKAIQALGHNMEGHAAGEATCTKDGNSAYWNCDRCNKYFSDEAGETEIGENSWVIEALGHDYEAIEGSAVAASCTEPGKEADEKCSRCDDVKTGKAIQALGHNMEGHAAGEATCTKDGNSAYWNCDRCNKYFSDEAGETEIGENSWVIEALGHDYEAIEGSAVAASCTKPGKEADEKCSRCDDVKTGKAIQALGHNMEGHAAGEATCTKDGNSAYWNCDRCNKYFSDEAGETEIGENSWVIEALGHDYEAIEGSAVAASCTEPGKEADEKCSRCDDVKTGKAIQAPGHKWKSTYTVDKKATYAATGSKSIHCSVCNAIKSGSKVTIPKLVVKPTTISKVTPAKKAFTVKWKKGSGVTGYQVQYALNSKFTSGKKTVKITKAGTVSKKITKLKAKKKYYVRVRTYKTVSGKTYYSNWSKYKYTKTK